MPCTNANRNQQYTVPDIYTSDACAVAACAAPATGYRFPDGTNDGSGSCTTEQCPTPTAGFRFKDGTNDGLCTTEQCPTPSTGYRFKDGTNDGACGTLEQCPVVAGEYYIEGTEECTTTSCTNRDTSTQYYDKQEVIIEDDCSVATCPTGKTPAANGLSCVDELKEKEKEAASDSNSPMVGAIVGSVVGVLVLVAVAGILVWVFVIRPRRL